MVFIKNLQRKIKINNQQLADQVASMLAAAGYAGFDVGIWLTTNKTIRKFNKQYRGKDKPTDVLSFPYHPLKPGERVKVAAPEDSYLGDIMISLEYAQLDAPKTWARPFRDHVVVLAAHGIAHLLGYDHLTEKQFLAMQKVEQKLLAAFD